MYKLILTTAHSVNKYVEGFPLRSALDQSLDLTEVEDLFHIRHIVVHRIDHLHDEAAPVYLKNDTETRIRGLHNNR